MREDTIILINITSLLKQKGVIMSNIGQFQQQRLSQSLSPQQIQMIKLLELPAIQLEQRVKQEIEENPVLEDEPAINDERGEEGEPKEISVEEYLKEDDTPHYKMRTNNYSKDDPQRSVPITGGRSLQEYLVEQLGYRDLTERQSVIAEYIVGSLDEDGYLRRDMQSLSDDLAFTLGIEASEAELEELLAVIQDLEPTGIGARNLQECLRLQLDQVEMTSKARRLARKIVTSHFEDFSKKHYEKLLARLGVDEELFRDAIGEIKKLSPKPGNLYLDAGSDTIPYIIPDFVLDYRDGEFELSLSSASIPEIRVNKRYVEMIRQMAGQGGSADREAMQFVKNKLDSAKWFISAIKQRHDTLLRTMTEMLDYQREYFKDGDKSKLRPMILKDIADRTGLDVSTISRVVNSKYVQTHFGILSLKQLFSEAMQTNDGTEVSSYEIKHILEECIDAEDKRKPLTDETLMEILNDKGYHIARRTVAKYREMLGIPVARLRKQI